MNLDTFFKKFDEFAGAPNAVQKMRELILALAMRGELVPQCATEDKVRDEITRVLFMNKSLKKAQIIKYDNCTEGPFPIPSSWIWVRFGDTVRIRTGKLDANAAVKNGKYPFFTCSNTPLTIDKYSFDTSAVILAGNGDFNIKSYSGKFDAYQRTYIMEPLGWELDFCFWLVSSQLTRITKNQRGSAIPYLRIGDITDTYVPFPPLAEQKRIVAKVDEFMALCDRLEAQEAELKEKGRHLSRAALARFAEKPTTANLGLIFYKYFNVGPADFRETILGLAVRGSLVPQDPNEGLALLEFKKIIERKNVLIKEKKIKKSKPSLRLDPSEIGRGIPKSWTWVRLVDICELITDGTHQTPKYTNEGRVFLSAQNVKPFMFIPEKHRFVSEEHYQGYIKNRKPEKGDILLTRVGAGIGEAATIDQDIDFAIYVSLGLVRPIRGFVFSDYITLWLNSPDGRAKSSKYTYGKGVSQGNLNLSLIRDFLVPLPPLAEQERIVAKVDELMALVDKLEAQQAKAHDLAERLMGAAVAEAAESTQRQGTKLVHPRTRIANEELREAFLIARIVSKTADPEHPLGRFRRTKFSYLAHRRAADDVTRHYIKKAAGPYSPWAKFDGPEDMARARGYVLDTKADPLEGMVAGERVGEVEEQVADPLIGEAVDWVMKNFHFETNDSLELLTTVDFAAVGLRKVGKEISREEVKRVIANSKDWTAKLKRELFSDENIDKALKRMAGVFPEMYGK